MCTQMTEQQTSEAALDTLNRTIAEALGYTVRFASYKHPTRAGFQVFDPEGQAVIGSIYCEQTEQLAWVRQCPDWARDPGAALALCLELARTLTTHKMIRVMITPLEINELQQPEPTVASFVEWVPVTVSLARQDICFYPNTFEGEGATPAEALARLALAALGAQHGRQS